MGNVPQSADSMHNGREYRASYRVVLVCVEREWKYPLECAGYVWCSFGWGILSIFISTTSYLVDVYASVASASALAANSFLLYELGAAVPLFAI